MLLLTRQQWQIGRDAEAVGVSQPGFVIGKSTVLTVTLPDIHERAHRLACLAGADLNLLAEERSSDGHSPCF